MNLTIDETRTFYKLWISILDYTNKKYNIAPKLMGMSSQTGINPMELIPIKDRLWSNVSIIDEFLVHMNSNLSADELEILESWKRRLSGKFIVFKHLKNYTIFMSTDKEVRSYGVSGITNPINDIFPSWRLPILVETVLIPFKNKIIYDSILLPHNIAFGSGIKNSFTEDYRNSKEKYGITTNI